MAYTFDILCLTCPCLRRNDFWKDPPLYFMGEAPRTIYNQTFFVGAWNIYQSDDNGYDILCLTCPFLCRSDQLSASWQDYFRYKPLTAETLSYS